MLWIVFFVWWSFLVACFSWILHYSVESEVVFKASGRGKNLYLLGTFNSNSLLVSYLSSVEKPRACSNSSYTSIIHFSFELKWSYLDVGVLERFARLSRTSPWMIQYLQIYSIPKFLLPFLPLWYETDTRRWYKDAGWEYILPWFDPIFQQQ